MDTQQIEQKVKANGRWAASEAKEMSKEAVSRGQDLLETIERGVAQLLDRGVDYASSGSRQAIVLAKKYPVQAVAGGAVIGFLLGATLFRRNRA